MSNPTRSRLALNASTDASLFAFPIILPFIVNAEGESLAVGKTSYALWHCRKQPRKSHCRMLGDNSIMHKLSVNEDSRIACSIKLCHPKQLLAINGFGRIVIAT